MVSTRTSNKPVLDGLQNEPRRPDTNGKRSRIDVEESDRPFKRQTLMTPTSRSTSDPLHRPHGSRGWKTDPPRNHLNTPRRMPRSGLKSHASSSKPIHISAQHRIAQFNASRQPSQSNMAENNNKTEQKQVATQHAEQESDQHSTAEPHYTGRTPQAPSQQPAAFETPSRGIFSHFFLNASKIVPTPLKWFQLSTSQAAETSKQEQNLGASTADEDETTSSSVQDEARDESTPRIGRSIFSGKPSAYHTPAHELEKLEKKRQIPLKKTNEEIVENLAREAAEIMARNRELGYAAPTAEDPEEHTTSERPATGQKRKLSTINGKLPGPSSGGFGISDEYLDQDNEIEGIDESTIDPHTLLETPVAKKQKTSVFQTPRSALKKPANTDGGTLLRSQKKVVFNSNPVASIRGLIPNYGRAGHYNGSVFSDLPNPFENDSLSSIDPAEVRGIASPITSMNTLENEFVDRTMDSNTRDPNDPDWRPSPANPRPGQFCLPDWDDDDDDTSVVQEEDSTITAPPASPRPAHAELPPSSPTGSSFNTNSILFESSELALNKARLQAEKYKPKDSSRLSQVEAARSRSSSPPLSDTTAAEAAIDKAPAATANGDGNKENEWTVDNELSPDDEDRDESGMNEYDRVHQHDKWAMNLPWPGLQTRVEAGLTSQFMADYVADHWGPEDDAQAAAFWDVEFARIKRVFEEAERQGVGIDFVNDEGEIVA